MRFFSDNAAQVHPLVMAAIGAADTLDTAYAGDAWSQQLDGRLSALFETEVAVLWVPTGTAANCLALAALCPPHGGIVCHRDAHIQNDEGGAPEFYTHGAKLFLADGIGAKLTPETIRTVLDATPTTSTASSRMRSRSPTPPNMAGFTFPTRSPRSARSRVSTGSASTWTARVLQTRWSMRDARPPT